MVVAGGFLLGAVLFAQLAQPVHKVFDPLQVERFVSFTQLFSKQPFEAARPKAPDLKVTTLEGKEVSLVELASQNQAIVINFWATWCGPCVQEMPYLEKIHRAYQGKGLVVMGIAAQESDAEVRTFIAERKITYTIAMDDQNQWAKAFGGINVLPTTVFLDSSNEIRKIHKGYLTEREFEATIDDLLSTSQNPDRLKES
jgi:thiol-disulfide isomerase/thioredoxin